MPPLPLNDQIRISARFFVECLTERVYMSVNEGEPHSRRNNSVLVPLRHLIYIVKINLALRLCKSCGRIVSISIDGSGDVSCA